MTTPVFLHWLRPRSYNGLLTALIVLVLAQVLVHQVGIGQWVLELVLAFVLAIAIFEVAGNRRAMRLAILLGVPAVLGRILAASLAQPPRLLIIVVFGLTIVFLIVVLISLMRHIMTIDRVSGDTLRGAVCIYLLLGVTWAIAYAFLFHLNSGAFNVADHLAPGAGGHGVTSLMMYFSFVTLTTLGYGDVTPITALARNLAWIEAMTGQLFVAITIAHLVGLSIARKVDNGGS